MPICNGKYMFLGHSLRTPRQHCDARWGLAHLRQLIIIGFSAVASVANVYVHVTTHAGMDQQGCDVFGR
jgi:hypothetical protein